MKNDWTIGDKGVKITFLQISPGFEREVWGFLERKLSKLRNNKDIGHYYIYKLFGHYDIGVLYECFDLKPDLLFQGSIPYIIDSNEIFCFTWQKGAYSFGLKQRKVIGIIFYKIRPEISRVFGIRIEQGFVKYMQDEIIKSGIKATLLGSLGWNEFIILVYDNSFDKLFDTIRLLTGTYLAKFETKVALKTYTIIGVRHTFLSNKTTIDKNFSSQRLSQNVSIQLSVICKPQDIDFVRERLRKDFNISKTYFSLGKTDLKIPITHENIGNWGELIKKLLDFRQEQKIQRRIFSTSTEVGIEIEKEEIATSKRSVKPLNVFLTQKHINQIRKYNSLSLEGVIGAFYTFNSLMNNELVMDCFFDIIQFMALLRLKCTTEEYKELDKKLERFRFGIDQRTYGTFISIEGTEGKFFPFKGGIQRVILALEAIPNVIFNYHGINWPGFLTVGFDDRYWHQEEVLNLPISKVFEPQDWWGLFHETGHAFIDLNPWWVDFNKEPFKSLLSYDLELAKGAEWGTRKELIKILVEVVADIYDLKVCFVGNYELYMKKIWSYLVSQMASSSDEEKESQLGSYLVRSFSVFIFYNLYEKHGMKLNYESLSYDKIKELSAAFYRGLSRVLPKDKMHILKLKRVKEKGLIIGLADKFSTIKGFMKEIKNKFDQLNLKMEEEKTLFRSHKLSILSERIEKGEIVNIDEIVNPIILLLKFFERGETSFKSKMAMILNLWNFYQKQYMPQLMDKIIAKPRQRKG